MGKKKNHGIFPTPPLPFSLMTPIPKRHPLISPRIHQKMRKGCMNDYLEAFGVVYWEKNSSGATTPLRRMRVNT